MKDDLALAKQEDAGMDPGMLAWLLRDFPLDPMPRMIAPLSREERRSYRDELAARMKRVATGGG